MHERPGAVENALASAPEPEAARDALLAVEPQALPQRQEATEGIAPAVPLASSDRIRGRVVRGRDAIPVAGVEVRCWKNLPPTRVEGPFRFDELSGRMLGQNGPLPESPSLRCTSGPDGRFEFPDLDRSAHYALEARGRGWVLVERLADVAPSEEELILAVQRVYVSQVLAIDESGASLPDSCQYLRYARVPAPGECTSLPFAELQTSAWPIRQASFRTDQPRYRTGEQYAFTSDCDAPRLGPFRILICCAGFERQDFEFWAYPEGFPSEVTTFRLRRAQDDSGALHVRQVCDCTGSSCGHLVEGTLQLASADASAEALQFYLTGTSREQEFGGIPKGRWRLQAYARYGGFSSPSERRSPVDIEIGEKPALFEIQVRELGAISWQVRAPGDRMASEPLWIVRRATDREESTNISSSVVMRGIPAGEHEFELDARKYSRVEGALVKASSGGSVLQVHVLPGETQLVVVHTP